MEHKSLFTYLLLTSGNFGAYVVTLTSSQTCFKLSALTPEVSLASHSGSSNISYKNQ